MDIAKSELNRNIRYIRLRKADFGIVRFGHRNNQKHQAVVIPSFLVLLRIGNYHL